MRVVSINFTHVRSSRGHLYISLPNGNDNSNSLHSYVALETHKTEHECTVNIISIVHSASTVKLLYSGRPRVKCPDYRGVLHDMQCPHYSPWCPH